MLTWDDIRRLYAAAGHPWFTGAWNLNLFGVRRLARPNTFDDSIGVAYEDGVGRRLVELWEATTDPGTYWLEHPMNVNGTAVLAVGCHRSLWQLGMHGGPTGYAALVQVSACAVWRDSDRDTVVDPEPRVLDTGLFGINLHRASASGTSTTVDRWSAGCQVLRRPGDLDRVLELVRTQQLAGKGSRVTYTLFDDDAF